MGRGRPPSRGSRGSRGQQLLGAQPWPTLTPKPGGPSCGSGSWTPWAAHTLPPSPPGRALPIPSLLSQHHPEPGKFFLPLQDLVPRLEVLSRHWRPHSLAAGGPRSSLAYFLSGHSGNVGQRLLTWPGARASGRKNTKPEAAWKAPAHPTSPHPLPAGQQARRGPGTQQPVAQFTLTHPFLQAGRHSVGLAWH